MKTFIILFLVSFNAFAQYKVEIFKERKLTNRGEFETMEEANSWLEKGKAEYWFARPAKTEMKNWN